MFDNKISKNTGPNDVFYRFGYYGNMSVCMVRILRSNKPEA